jgi:hypothetical protein
MVWVWLWAVFAFAIPVSDDESACEACFTGYAYQRCYVYTEGSLMVLV